MTSSNSLKRLSRRELLVVGVGALAAGACGDLGSADGDTATDETGDGDAETGGETGECSLSPADIEGPAYRPNIPIGGDLDVHGDAGVPLVFEGRVLDTSCGSIQNAVVELWHTSASVPGAQPGDVNASYDASAEYRYYGQVATDAEGRFTFRTLKPGWYLNGAQYRPAHLHIKVWIDGEERLTSQVYFVGDPFNDIDPWFNPVMALDPDSEGRASLDLVV